MSSAPRMTKPEPNDDLRYAVERHIENMERAIVEAKRFLEDLERGPDARDLEVLKLLHAGGGVDFTGAAPFEAIRRFLQHVGTMQPRWVILRALLLSRVPLGNDPKKTVNQSISTNVGIGKLIEPHPLKDGRGPSEDSMVGLPGMKFGR